MTVKLCIAAATIGLCATAAQADETVSLGRAQIALAERMVGGDIIVAKDVRGIFALGGRILVQDSKTETMMAAAGDIRTENATIDVAMIAAGTIAMTGGSVKELRAAAGTLDLNTQVSKDVDVAGGSVRTGPTMTVDGTTHVSAGIANLAGIYGGTVTVEADTVEFSGTTNGDLRISARQVTLLPGAVIGGDLIAPTLTVIPDGVTVKGDKAIGAKNVKTGGSDGVSVTVDLDGKTPKKDNESDDSGLISPEPMGMGSWFTVLLTLAICGALALGVAPQFVAGAAERLAKDPLPSLGVGLVSLLAVPMALVLVGITIIGIPLAVLGAAAYAIGIGLGLICLCLWGGLMVRTLAHQPGQETRLAKLVGWTLMGFLALALIGAIPLIGRWIQVLAVVAGAGAVISTAWAARKKNQVTSDHITSAQPT
jgi:cytoskeletal protein CcmA (bactofilin family)